MRYTFGEVYGQMMTWNLDPQKVGEELDSLRMSNDGILVWEDVIEFAKGHTRSDCNKAIEWDDKKAAHAHRKNQVRSLIRSVRVRRNNKSVRAFITIKGKKGYYSFDDVMADEQMREDLVEGYMKRLTSIQEETKAIKEFAKVNAEIERAREKRLRVKRAA